MFGIDDFLKPIGSPLIFLNEKYIIIERKAWFNESSHVEALFVIEQFDPEIVNGRSASLRDLKVIIKTEPRAKK